MITNFINEGRGISDIIKQYSEIIYSYYEEGNYQIQLDFDYNPLPLIDLRIIINYTNKYHGIYNLDYSKLENNKLHDIIINLEIDKNDIDKYKIIGLITHELTHIKEYYDIHIKMEKNKIIIKPQYLHIKSIYNEYIENNNKINDSYGSFMYLIYLSLDTEMNARISQVYHYLYSFNIKDENILFEKLKQHKNYEYLQLLMNFDYENFVNYNIKKIELSGLLKITNDLIEKFKDKNLNKNTKLLIFIEDDLNDLNDLYNFYKNWSNYFKIKSDKHLEKFKYLIKEVIEDLNGNRPWNEGCRIDIKIKDFLNKQGYDTF